MYLVNVYLHWMCWFCPHHWLQFSHVFTCDSAITC